MCRWIVYFGNDVTVANAIGTYGHGLVDVAHKPVHAPNLSKERLYDADDIPVNFQENGEGFGVGFYSSDPELTFPAVLRDCKPIWHSLNLGPVGNAVKSPLVFGHVRKAHNTGTVFEQNCHPFTFGVYMFMHNGVVSKFHKIRARILMTTAEIFDSVSKDHDMENKIMGTTDTEALFYLILALIAKLKGSLDLTKRNCTVQELADCLQEGVRMVLGMAAKKTGLVGVGSRLNLAFTDGEKLVVTRFRNAMKQPPSLYYTMRERDAKKVGTGTIRGTLLENIDELKLDEREHTGMSSASNNTDGIRRLSTNFGFSLVSLPKVIMIASEPVDGDEESQYWELVPRNEIMMITKKANGELRIESEQMKIPDNLYQVPEKDLCVWNE